MWDCGEEPNGARVELEERDKLSLLLDPRTALGPPLPVELLKECYEALKKEYVRYSSGARAYKAEKAAEKRAAKRKAADAAAAAAASVTDADATVAVTEVASPAEETNSLASGWDCLLAPAPVRLVLDEEAAARAILVEEEEARVADVGATVEEYVTSFTAYANRGTVTSTVPRYGHLRSNGFDWLKVFLQKNRKKGTLITS